MLTRHNHINKRAPLHISIPHMNVPAPVIEMLLACFGGDGRAWLDALPRVVEELCARWGLELGEPFEGGCVAYVAPALRADGERLVLKVSFIDEETRHEGDALALWNGEGAVRLIDHDSLLGALLLERLEPGLPLHRLPDRDAAISIACRLLKRLRHRVPAGHPFELVSALARRWALELRPRFESAASQFDAALLDHAAALCRELATSKGEIVLVNRDFHLGNVLSAQREPWLLIDPKPLAGEAAFGAGYLLLSEAGDGTDAAALARRLAAELDLVPQRVAAWAFVRAVENAVWAAETAHDPSPDIACAESLQSLVQAV